MEDRQQATPDVEYFYQRDGEAAWRLEGVGHYEWRHGIFSATPFRAPERQSEKWADRGNFSGKAPHLRSTYSEYSRAFGHFLATFEFQMVLFFSNGISTEPHVLL